MSEAKRVLKSRKIIAFTDWLQIGTMTESEWTDLNGFMAFPYMETLERYANELEKSDFKILEAEDLSPDFTWHYHVYQDMLRNKLKNDIIAQYEKELFEVVDSGLTKWVHVADES